VPREGHKLKIFAETETLYERSNSKEGGTREGKASAQINELKHVGASLIVNAFLIVFLQQRAAPVCETSRSKNAINEAPITPDDFDVVSGGCFNSAN
jgi:hypothetical protein